MQADLAGATHALKRIQAMGPMASDVPTPHRLLRAEGRVTVERAPDGEGSAAVKRPRVRTIPPLEDLARRKLLDPNPVLAAAMLRAGLRYAKLFGQAGLSPVASADPMRVRAEHGEISTAAEMRESARQEFARAAAILPGGMRGVRAAVDGIVLQEASLHDVGRTLGRYPRGDRTSAIAIATFVLRDGLERLAVHFGLVAADGPHHRNDNLDGMLAEVYQPAADLTPRMEDLLGVLDGRGPRAA